MTAHLNASMRPARLSPRVPDRVRQALLPVFCAAFLGASLPARANPGPVTTEYRIKAAFLYNFSRFVEWPPQHFASDRPLTIGVLGENPFGGELQKIVQDRRINGREIAIIEIVSPADVRGIDVAFVCEGAEHRLADFMPELVAASVLTVGESPSFTANGGVIHFIRDGDKVRFEVNLDAAERQGLKLSAQLLKLATAVHRKS